MTIKTRPYQSSDENFILSSWLKSNRASHPLVTDAVYFDHHKALIKRLIATSTVVIACDPEAPEVIYAYAVYQSNIVHYCYVKHTLRRFGVAKALLVDVPRPFQFTSPATSPALTARLIVEKATYNPYLAWEIK